MDYFKIVLLLVQILLIAGALNWGLVAYNGTDIVDTLAGKQIGQYVKFAVAAAGLVQIYALYTAATTTTPTYTSTIV